MSEGVINSSSGAHEHKTDIESGLVNKDKSTYTQQSVELQQQNIRKRKPQNRYFEEQKYYDEKNYRSRNQSSARLDSSVQGVTYQNDLSSPISQSLTQKNERSVANGNFSNDVRYKKNTQNGYRGTKITADNKNKSVSDSKLETGIKGVSYSDNITSQKVKSSIGTAVTGTSFLANAESFQTDTGESSINAIKKSADHVVNKLDKLSAKSGKSRYFRTAAKTSDSVTFVSHADRLKNAVYKGQQFGKKGLGAVSKRLNPLVKTLNLSDDVGAQSMVKAVDVTRGSVNAAKMSFKTTKQAVQATSKATRYTVNHARIGLENAAKYSKQAISKSKKAAKVVSKTAQTVARAAAETAEKAAAAVSRFISFVISNPVTIIIAVVVLLLVIIIAFSSTIVGAGQYFSYGGVGDSNTLSLNDYSAVYDYINKSIAQRCLDLFNLQYTWTGFLEYNYQYKIENDDGTFTDSVYYPIADVAPIMACLSINHQTYTLDNQIKTEIDDIINYLYTFDYLIEPCTKIVYHDNDHYTTYTGEKVTYTITYHNADSFLENNGYIPSEKKSTYYAIKSYGDMTYFRMYNILKDKNWHDWIVEQYGYSVSSRYNHSTGLYEHELVNHDYCKLGRKNNNPVPDIYSPLNGTVTKLTETSDYDYELTIKDSQNNLEFTIMAEFQQHFHPQVNVGDNVVAGQLIAKNNYDVYIKCKAQADSTLYVNPMLIMEYYQHAN